MTEKNKSLVKKAIVTGTKPAQSPNTHGYVPADIPAKPSSSSTTTGQGGGDSSKSGSGKSG